MDLYAILDIATKPRQGQLDLNTISEIVGIVAGVVAIISAIAGAIIVIYRYSRDRRSKGKDKPPSGNAPIEIVITVILRITPIVVMTALFFALLGGISTYLTRPMPTPTPTPPATPTPVGTVTYTTNNPGPQCDTQGGIWTTNLSTNDAACSGKPNGKPSQGTGVVAPSASSAGNLFFRWPAHPFTETYTVAVTISPPNVQPPGSQPCVGLETHLSDTPEKSHSGGYVFYACADGTWEIDLLTDNASSPGTPLASGNLAGQPIDPGTQIKVVVKGVSQSLYIDGALIGAITDQRYTSTSQVSLYLTAEPGSAYGYGAAIFFSDFTCTIQV